MPYNFAAESFHTKKLCSRLIQEKPKFYRKNGKKRFSVPLSGLGSTYELYLRFIGKLVEDFLLGAFDLSQNTRLTDRQTDGRTDRQNLHNNTVRMLRSRTVKMNVELDVAMYVLWCSMSTSVYGIASLLQACIYVY